MARWPENSGWSIFAIGIVNRGPNNGETAIRRAIGRRVVQEAIIGQHELARLDEDVTRICPVHVARVRLVREPLAGSRCGVGNHRTMRAGDHFQATVAARAIHAVTLMIGSTGQ